MSTLRVTAERLTVHPHPNADALELAQVGLYRAVVPKGVYATGDVALYIPEQAIVPDALIEELGLTGRLAGPDRNRVRAIRLRGELSQGIVCRPAALTDTDLETAAVDGSDFAEWLRITKWVPPIPVHMSGEVVPAVQLLPWIEIENIRRHPDLFTPGERVIATEKVHGTACLYTYVAATGESFVSSKGFGSKSLALVRNDDNLYWRAVLAHRVPEIAVWIANQFGAGRVGIFGEVYGAGVQDLAYGANAKKTPGYAVFDVAIAHEDGPPKWFNACMLPAMVRWNCIALPVVPRLYEGPYDEDVLLALAEGKETVSGAAAHVREGVVVRPFWERYSPILNGRAIGKIVSEAYLTRKGGTEFE